MKNKNENVVKNTDPTENWPGHDTAFHRKRFIGEAGRVLENLPRPVVGLLARFTLLFLAITIPAYYFIIAPRLSTSFIAPVPDIRRGEENKYYRLPDTGAPIRINDAEMLDRDRGLKDGRVVVGTRTAGILVYEPNKPGRWEQIPFHQIASQIITNRSFEGEFQENIDNKELPKGSVTDIASTGAGFPSTTFVSSLNEGPGNNEFAIVHGDLEDTTFRPLFHSKQKEQKGDRQQIWQHKEKFMPGPITRAVTAGGLSAFASDTGYLGIYQSTAHYHECNVFPVGGTVWDIAATGDHVWWAGSDGLFIYKWNGQKDAYFNLFNPRLIDISTTGACIATLQDHSLHLLPEAAQTSAIPVIPFSKAGYIEGIPDISEAALLGHSLYLGKKNAAGIDEYDTGKHRWTNHPLTFPVAVFRSTPDRYGRLAVIGTNGQLAVLKPGSPPEQRFTGLAPWSSGPQIRSMAIAPNNVHYFATDRGTAAWDYQKDTWTELNSFTSQNNSTFHLLNNQLYRNNIRSILLDDQYEIRGTIKPRVFALSRNRIFLLEKETWVLQEEWGNRVAQMLRDDRGTLWWLNDDGGTKSLHNENSQSYFHGPLPGQWDLAAPAEDTIWMVFKKPHHHTHRHIAVYDIKTHNITSAPLQQSTTAVSLVAPGRSACIITASGKQIRFDKPDDFESLMGTGRFPGSDFGDVVSIARYKSRIWLAGKTAIGRTYLTSYEPRVGRWNQHSIRGSVKKLAAGGDALAVLYTDGTVDAVHVGSSPTAHYRLPNVTDILQHDGSWFILSIAGDLEKHDPSEPFPRQTNIQLFSGSCPPLGRPIRAAGDSENNLILFGGSGIGKYDPSTHSWENRTPPNIDSDIRQVIKIHRDNSFFFIFCTHHNIFRLIDGNRSPNFMEWRSRDNNTETMRIENISAVTATPEQNPGANRNELKTVLLKVEFSRDSGTPGNRITTFYRIGYDRLYEIKNIRQSSPQMDRPKPEIAISDLRFLNRDGTFEIYDKGRKGKDRKHDLNFKSSWRFGCDRILKLSLSRDGQKVLAVRRDLKKYEIIFREKPYVRTTTAALPSSIQVIDSSIDPWRTWSFNSGRESRESPGLTVSYRHNNREAVLVGGRFSEDIATVNAAVHGALWTGSKNGVWKIDDHRKRSRWFLKNHDIKELSFRDNILYAETTGSDVFHANPLIEKISFKTTRPFPPTSAYDYPGGSAPLQFSFTQNKMVVKINGRPLSNPTAPVGEGAVMVFDDIVSAAVSNDRSHLWIGTRNNGLWLYEYPAMTPLQHVSTREGLPSNHIPQVEFAPAETGEDRVLRFRSGSGWYKALPAEDSGYLVSSYSRPTREPIGLVDNVLRWTRENRRIYPQLEIGDRRFSFRSNWLVNRRMPFTGCRDITFTGDFEAAVLVHEAVAFYDMRGNTFRLKDYIRLPSTMTADRWSRIKSVGRDIFLKLKGNDYMLENRQWVHCPSQSYPCTGVTLTPQDLHWNGTASRSQNAKPFEISAPGDHREARLMMKGRFSFDVVNDAVFLLSHNRNHERQTGTETGVTGEHTIFAGTNAGLYTFKFNTGSKTLQTVAFDTGTGPVQRLTNRWGACYYQNTDGKIFVLQSSPGSRLRWFPTADLPFRKKQVVFDPESFRFSSPQIQQTKALTSPLQGTGFGSLPAGSLVKIDNTAYLTTSGGIVKFAVNNKTRKLTPTRLFTKAINMFIEPPTRTQWHPGNGTISLRGAFGIYRLEKKRIPWPGRSPDEITLPGIPYQLRCTEIGPQFAIPLTDNKSYGFALKTDRWIYYFPRDKRNSTCRVVDGHTDKGSVILLHGSGKYGFTDRLETVRLTGIIPPTPNDDANTPKTGAGIDTVIDTAIDTRFKTLWEKENHRIFKWEGMFFLQTTNRTTNDWKLFAISNLKKKNVPAAHQAESGDVNGRIPFALGRGQNIWNTIKLVLQNRKIQADERQLGRIKDCVLLVNGLTEQDARHLPIGKKVVIPADCLNRTLKGNEQTTGDIVLQVDEQGISTTGDSFLSETLSKAASGYAKNMPTYFAVIASGDKFYFQHSKTRYGCINRITGDIYYHGVEGEIEEEFWRFSYHPTDTLKTAAIGSSVMKRQLRRGFKRHNVSLAYQRNGRTLDIYWNDKKSVFNLESVFPVQSENLLKIFPSDIDNEAWLITDSRLFRINLDRLPLDDSN